MKLALKIALTHLLSKRKQTLVAMLGVTFGIAMFILMISFMTGVNLFLEDSMLTSTPHVRIYHDVTAERLSVAERSPMARGHHVQVLHQRPFAVSLNLRETPAIMKKLQKDKRVLGISPQVGTQVFYSMGAVQLGGLMAGVDIIAEDNLFGIRKRIKSGSFDDLLKTTDGVIMGIGLARKLNVQVGDRVTVSTPQGTQGTIKVAAIFGFGVGAIDNVKCYAAASTVHKLLGKDSRYFTDINIKLKNIDDTDVFAAEWRRNGVFSVEDWKKANETILVSFTIRNVLTVVVSITLLIVAGFGIYNIMNMTIHNKMKDIAILKATGFNSGDIMRIFIGQSVLIGTTGGTIGLVLGFLLSYTLSLMPFHAGEFLAIDTFPVNFDFRFYVFGLVFGILTTLVAGLFPSMKAGKLDPVAILRG
jgi:lipoprotein-releasing system permease protein